MTELTAQQRAEKKRAEKRKGAAVFAPVRFSEADKTPEQKKAWIESVITIHGGTREAALLAAFEALENNLK